MQNVETITVQDVIGLYAGLTVSRRRCGTPLAPRATRRARCARCGEPLIGRRAPPSIPDARNSHVAGARRPEGTLWRNASSRLSEVAQTPFGQAHSAPLRRDEPQAILPSRWTFRSIAKESRSCARPPRPRRELPQRSHTN